LLGILAFAPGTASADPFVITLDAANISDTGPYAQVTVNLTSSTTADVTFQSLTSGGNIFLMGAQGAVALNVNGDVTVGTITGTNSGTGFTPGPLSVAAAGNEDGFGSFNFTVDSFDSYTHSSDTVTFTLTNTSGTWASSADVLTPNEGGYLAAAHILVTTYPADASGSASVTGYAAGQGGETITAVPEPGSVALALTGALGFGLAGLRRFRRRVTQ